MHLISYPFVPAPDCVYCYSLGYALFMLVISFSGYDVVFLIFFRLSNAITRQKRKFQLIVITHDEKFLDRMSRDKRMEKYYRVDRNKK